MDFKTEFMAYPHNPEVGGSNPSPATIRMYANIDAETAAGIGVYFLYAALDGRAGAAFGEGEEVVQLVAADAEAGKLVLQLRVKMPRRIALGPLRMPSE